MFDKLWPPMDSLIGLATLVMSFSKLGKMAAAAIIIAGILALAEFAISSPLDEDQ